MWFLTSLILAQNAGIKPLDLLFQDLECGPMCDAIEEVTQGHEDHRFSHVAIAIDAKFVIEAIGKEVAIEKMSTFLNRSVDNNKKPKVAIGKISSLDGIDRKNILTMALNKLGIPYDGLFQLGEDKLYCSELVYYSFKKEKPLFDLNKMTFKIRGDNAFYPVWVNYFKKLKSVIPEGEPGINPGSISRSELVEMSYPFGIISKN